MLINGNDESTELLKVVTNQYNAELKAGNYAVITVGTVWGKDSTLGFAVGVLLRKPITLGDRFNNQAYFNFLVNIDSNGDIIDYGTGFNKIVN